MALRISKWSKEQSWISKEYNPVSDVGWQRLDEVTWVTVVHKHIHRYGHGSVAGKDEFLSRSL